MPFPFAQVSRFPDILGSPPSQLPISAVWASPHRAVIPADVDLPGPTMSFLLLMLLVPITRKHTGNERLKQPHLKALHYATSGFEVSLGFFFKSDKSPTTQPPSKNTSVMLKYSCHDMGCAKPWEVRYGRSCTPPGNLMAENPSVTPPELWLEPGSARTLQFPKLTRLRLAQQRGVKSTSALFLSSLQPNLIAQKNRF